MKNLFKPTKGIIVAWVVLLILTIYLLLPAPYASTVSGYLGIFGSAISAITMLLILPVIVLHDMLVNYLFIFFAIVLVYNYLMICIIAKLFKKNRPNLTMFFIFFIILEIITYIVGSIITWYAQCSVCIIGAPCPPCPSGNYGVTGLLFGVIFNSLIAFLLAKLVTRHTLKP